jgi:pyruvate dehydrogenase E1 component beta subunit
VPVDDLLAPVARSGRILVVEEGCLTGGWGAEVSALIHERQFKYLQQPVQRIGAADCPIPSASDLERAVLPSVDTIRDKVRAMLG